VHNINISGRNLKQEAGMKEKSILNLNSENNISIKCGKMDGALLQDYLEGTIDPVAKLFVEAHLNTCKDCRRELSELKLMFWELGNKSNYRVEYPQELDEMAGTLIDRVLGKEEKSTARKLVDLQVGNLKGSTRFLDYLPGARKTPEVIKKASRSLVKGVGKGVKKGVERMLTAR
jgi:anti-sigma factor ChrR (cupin superfamily)